MTVSSNHELLGAPELPLNFSIQIYDSSTIPDSVIQACVKLVAKIKHMYNASGMGWNTRKKKEEFKIPGMQFIVVYDNGNQQILDDQCNSIDSNYQVPHNFTKLAAFVSVLPSTPEFLDDDEDEYDDVEDEEDEQDDKDQDDDEITKNDHHYHNRDISRIYAGQFENLTCENRNSPHSSTIHSPAQTPMISYLYELHVAQDYKNQGLAKFLLNQAKSICQDQNDITKLMLTVFNMNVPAQNFYLWNNFEYLEQPEEPEYANEIRTRTRQQCLLDSETGNINKTAAATQLSVAGGSAPKSTLESQKRHNLHPKLPYSKTHRIVKGWQEMVWHKPSNN